MKESSSYPVLYLVQSGSGIDSLFGYRTIQAISIGKERERSKLSSQREERTKISSALSVTRSSVLKASRIYKQQSKEQRKRKKEFHPSAVESIIN